MVTACYDRLCSSVDRKTIMQPESDYPYSKRVWKILRNGIEAIRMKLANWIVASGMPYRKAISDRVMSARHRKMLDDFGADFKASHDQFYAMVAELSAKSEICARWLTEENFTKVGGRLIMMDGLQFLLLVMDSPENVAVFFERYIVTEAAFKAVILFYYRLPMDFKTNQLDPEDAEIVEITATNALTRILIKACPGRWDYDTLLAELRAF